LGLFGNFDNFEIICYKYFKNNKNKEGRMKKVIIIISGLIVWYFGYYECESFCVLEGQGQDYQAIISSSTPTGETTNPPVSPFIDFSDNPELVINDFVIRYFYEDVIPGLSSKLYAEYTFENYTVENISPENLPKDLSDMEFQQVDNAKYFRVKFDATSKETGEQFKEVIIYYQVFLDENNMIRVNRYWANGTRGHSSYIYYGPDLPDLPAPWTGMNNIPRRVMEDGLDMCSELSSQHGRMPFRYLTESLKAKIPEI